MRVSSRSSSSAFVILVGCSKFNAGAFNVQDTNSMTTPTTRCTSSSTSRGCHTSLQMSHSHPDNSREDSIDSVDTSRREALGRCASIFTAFAFTWDRQREVSFASEFSDGIEPTIAPITPTNSGAASQFADESAITPVRPQAMQQQQEAAPETSSPPISVVTNQVTLENSQVVTIPTTTTTTETPVVWSGDIFNEADIFNEETKKKSDDRIDVIGLTPEEAKKRKNSLPAELGIFAIFGAGLFSVVGGRVSPNTDDLGTKAKVVMITPDPYGLDTGRRFYNGVDITRKDPIPASDVREYCEAGKLNNDCIETIAGFLGQVQSNSDDRDGPSMSQQETANAVLSYLDSLPSTSGYNPINYNTNIDSKRTIAFSSYLNILSDGETRAPQSPQMVSDYLSSLVNVQGRIEELEKTIYNMPDEITGRMQSWQLERDEKLTHEFLKIEEYLMKNQASNVNTNESVPSIDMRGKNINGVYN